MTERRLFVATLPGRGGELTLDPDAARHARVLRLAVGDAVTLFDGSGHQAEAEVVAVGRRLVCRARPPRGVPRPGPRVVLVLCQPKGQKTEEAVRVATELGVSAVRLALSERVVARSAPERAARRLERLEKVAREAARQSEQAFVPLLAAAEDLAAVLAQAPDDAAKIAFYARGRGTLGDHLPAETSELWLVLGPEGGLSDRDLDELAAADFAPVGLGAAVLRVETAIPVALGLVLAHIGTLRT